MRAQTPSRSVARRCPQRQTDVAVTAPEPRRRRRHPLRPCRPPLTLPPSTPSLSPTPSTPSPSPAALLRWQRGEHRPFSPPLPLSPPPAAPPAAAGAASPASPPGSLAGALSPRAPATRSTKCGAHTSASTSPSMLLHGALARRRPCREHVAVHAASTSPSMHAHVARLDVVVHNDLPVEVR
jgi:hypothetical protein